jgi:GNAT superfamily N-acetyltransferase
VNVSESTNFSQPPGLRLLQAGITLHHTFEPGDLGQLIQIHGVQNNQDYGFNAVHEAYCARIATDFILESSKGRSKAWLAKQEGSVVGSVLIFEQPDDQAQLRLLFVDKSVRGCGLGRWLVEQSVRYCISAGFRTVYLWTVRGLDRAISIYTSLGFKEIEVKETMDWGRRSEEVRYELVISNQ